MTYSEKLKDPRWQKKRLEIFERDSFYCQRCYDDTSTLMVHHNYYLPNTDPWEYHNECLVTLCQECHNDEHKYRAECEKNLLTILRQRGYNYVDIQVLAQVISSLDINEFNKMCAQAIPYDLIFKHCNPVPQQIDGIL